MSIIVDPEFKNLIPPLSEDEFNQLEENCVKDGIREPLVVWPQGDGNDILIDGHNRWKISTKHAGIQFQIKRMEFQSRDDVVVWIIRNQLGRRNLSAYDRSILALRLKPVIAEKAEKNLHQGQEPLQKSVNPINTQKELASIAGVSHDTIHKVEKIEREATERTKQLVREGHLSINQAYNSTFPARPDPVKVAKEEHEEFQKEQKQANVVSFQDIQKDKVNRNIIQNAIGQDTIKLVNAIMDFGRKHKTEDLLVAFANEERVVKAIYLDELDTCEKVLSRIRLAIEGGKRSGRN